MLAAYMRRQMDHNHTPPARMANLAAGPRPHGPVLAHLVYGLQAVSLFTGVPMLVGVIVNYLTRGQVRGTWLDSHYGWQIRTFWYSLLWTVLGSVTAVILVGYVVLAIAYLWLIYRIARGWMNLANGVPIYPADRISTQFTNSHPAPDIPPAPTPRQWTPGGGV